MIFCWSASFAATQLHPAANTNLVLFPHFLTAVEMIGCCAQFLFFVAKRTFSPFFFAAIAP
jgi:hypothetical protein